VHSAELARAKRERQRSMAEAMGIAVSLDERSEVD